MKMLVENYYPVMSHIWIKDNKKQMIILIGKENEYLNFYIALF